MNKKNHHVHVAATLQEESVSVTFPGKPTSSHAAAHFTSDCWFDDACILDMDCFVKTLAGIKAKGVRPDLIGSIITHYACKWLPDLDSSAASATSADKSSVNSAAGGESESVTVSWMKKRFFVETLVGVLPAEKDAMPCNFLLRLLRTANMVGVEGTYRAELERRISWQLEWASLKELMIPSFSHTCATLLDVELVLRLVKRFVGMDDAAKSGAAPVKVAKLVDGYLAEAALDANFTTAEFVALAAALPSHARAFDDGLYRAIDTYLKAHPSASKHERRSLCRLIDSRKLSPEASLHAAQNERLPVRAVIQVLFSEQSKLSRCVTDWSGSFSGIRSPNCLVPVPDTAPAPAPATRCLSSKREASAQQAEIRRLREDVVRLQSQLNSVQAQLDRVLVLTDHQRSKHQSRSGTSGFGFFRWRKFGFVPSSMKSTSTTATASVAGHKIDEEREVGAFDMQTPMVNMKTKLARNRTPPKWRRSMS